MTRVGGFVVGDGTKVDRTGLTTAQQNQFNAVAGVSPSYPGRTVPMRVRCAEIWRFDPLTWLPTAKLTTATTQGASRSATLTEPGFQQETLTFTVLDATTVLNAGDWLCVRWSVTAGGSTTTHLGGVYRVASAAPRELRGVATTLQVTALDWFQYDASQIDGAGSVALSQLAAYRDAYAAAGLPQFSDGFSFIPDDANAIGNTLGGAILARATVWTGSVKPLRVHPWATLVNAWAVVAADVLTPGALIVGNAGSPTTLYDTLRKLWLLVGGFTLAYDLDGYLLLTPGGDRATASGAYITCDTTPLGSIPLPWATPLQRALTRPEFDRVSYFLRRDPAPSADTGVGGATIEGTLAGPAAVSSFAAIHPFNSSSKGTEEVVDTIPWFGADINHTFQAMGFESDLAWCRYRLRQHLAAADTVAFSVDPAYPMPPLGQLLRVNLPPDVAGDYQLVSVNQPLTAQMASYQARWWEDR